MTPTSDSLWPGGLDVGLLRSRGWAPKPFRQFVVKVHSRCNLACTYCYVYEAADQGWRSQPRMMSDDVFTAACSQIATHAASHSMPSVSLIFHGGEPLLIGAEALDRFASIATRIVGDVTRVSLGMQTNGLLLDDATLAVCEKHGIRVAVSIDGDADGHDRNRLFRNGSGSHASVSRGIRRLQEHQRLYAGLLCTVDLRNDPLAVYRALLEFSPPTVDFLLPHGNWTTPPPGIGEYGPWLATIFDEWFDSRPTGVRLFDDILALMLGGQGTSESVGLLPIRVAVFETDGTIEQVDTLKTAYEGATKVGVPDLEQALWEPQIVARQIGVEALGETCRECRLRDVCGGGNYVHRFREGSGFRNPSVFCPDLMFLIDHARHRVTAEWGRVRGR